MHKKKFISLAPGVNLIENFEFLTEKETNKIECLVLTNLSSLV
jgi:hypothetical protein